MRSNFRLDDVLKNPKIDETQKQNIRTSLFSCRHSKLQYNPLNDTLKNLQIRVHDYEISDDESENLSKSLNENSDESNLSRSSDSFHESNETESKKLTDLESEFKKTSLATEHTIGFTTECTSDELEDILSCKSEHVDYKFQNLNDYEKKLIEMEDTKRKKKFEQAKSIAKTVQEKSKDSFSPKIQLLKDQQKLLKESLPAIVVARKTPVKDPKKELEEQQEKEKVKELETKLADLAKELNSLQQKCTSTDYKDLFEKKTLIEELKSAIKAIESVAKTSNEMSVVELKYSKVNQELKTKIESTIEQHHLKVKELKEKTEKQNQTKYLDEIGKYKKKYLEVKSFLEHLVNEKLESKRSTINHLANRQLDDEVNEFDISIKSHIKDVDAYINKTLDKMNMVVVADQKESQLNQIFSGLSETLERFIRVGQDHEKKLSILIKTIQNLEKRKEKDMQDKQADEQRKIELAKQKELEASRQEKEKLLKQQAEEEHRSALIKKQQEIAAAKAAAELAEKQTSVKSVNYNDKNGINRLTLDEFESNKKFFEQLRNQVEESLSDKSLKVYKFDLQKAINFPLNSLLDDKTNEENVRNFNEKIRTLCRLLAGQTCSITSTLVVNPTKHPSAIHFCLIYLAKKVVEKAEETVSSRPETSFQYCQLVKDVFKQCPQFETILMGQIQEKCPFVVPYYKPRSQNQTDNEYFESLGYKVTNGKVEDDILYYKRMNGVLYLYFTLLMNTTNLRAGVPQGPISTNHFTNGYKKAWQWLSDVLNMTPRPDITAEMLTIFFKCCGFQLQRAYGKQFLKLINTCFTDFIQLIKTIPSNKQSGASVGRLEAVFDEYKRNHQFSEWKN